MSIFSQGFLLSILGIFTHCIVADSVFMGCGSLASSFFDLAAVVGDPNLCLFLYPWQTAFVQ
jgi:hypothetical protein